MKSLAFPRLFCLLIFALGSFVAHSQTPTPETLPRLPPLEKPKLPPTERKFEDVPPEYQPGRGTGDGAGFGGGAGLGPGIGGGGPGQTGPIDYNKPFTAKEVTRKAVLLTKPEPTYTEQAKKHSVEGVVTLRVLLSASGKVTTISPLSRLPDGLTEEAIAAARQIMFKPAQKDGREVSQWIVIQYAFNLFRRKGDPDLLKDAEITEQPAAKYTDQARAKGITGKVVLDVGLDPSGNVFVIKVIQSLPEGLTEQAIESANKIKFKPAVSKAGQPVLQAQTVEYEFKLP